MKPFIKKHEYNYIKKCLNDLNNAFRNCIDINIVEANKAYIHNKILSLFSNLSKEEKEVLHINKITDPLHIDNYLQDLNEYVYETPNITKQQIIKLFKKQKKLTVPKLDTGNSKKVYLSWIDESTRRLFIVYNMNNKPIGMVCKIQNYDSSNSNMCTLCNYIGKQNEITFVTCKCKTPNSTEGTYRSIGFHICLDREKCNERIMYIEKLEKILKEVNNIK